MSNLASTNKTAKKIIVQKYGGATLADPEKIKYAAKRIFKLQQAGVPLVVIVSAMGQTTNDLIELASKVSTRPHLRELDMLLSVGERISMSLLSMALNDLGCPAISFTGSQAGIMTDDSHVNANIIDVKAFRVEQALAENKVVILAGFQGVSAQTKEITTLGRGGSDITAVAMAAYLKAERCEILKDVDCIYTADPKVVKTAQPIHELNYLQLLEMTTWGAKVLHHRSVKLASDKNVTLYVGPANDDSSAGTLVSHNCVQSVQKPMAINSFSLVFEMKLTASIQNFEDFQNYLQKNQIGKTQLLFQHQEKFYITAPQEILNTLIAFEKIQKDFIFTNISLCTVSLTFSQVCTEKELTLSRNSLVNSGITPAHTFMTGNSVNFVLASERRTDSINYLHSFCLSFQKSIFL